jgi:NAD-dependent DNA ligase
MLEASCLAKISEFKLKCDGVAAADAAQMPSGIQIQPFQEALQLCEELSPQHEQIVATGASELSRGAKTAALIESVVSIVKPMDVRGLLDNREQAQILSNALDESADYIKLDESTAAVLKPLAEKMHAELFKTFPNDMEHADLLVKVIMSVGDWPIASGRASHVQNFLQPCYNVSLALASYKALGEEVEDQLANDPDRTRIQALCRALASQEDLAMSSYNVPPPDCEHCTAPCIAVAVGQLHKNLVLKALSWHRTSRP